MVKTLQGKAKAKIQWHLNPKEKKVIKSTCDNCNLSRNSVMIVIVYQQDDRNTTKNTREKWDLKS